MSPEVAGILGCGVGASALWLFFRLKVGGYEQLGREIIKRAEWDAEAGKNKAELESKQLQLEQKRILDREDERLKMREEKLETRVTAVDRKYSELEKKEVATSKQKELLEADRKEVRGELERIAALTGKEAKELLLQSITADVSRDAARLTRRMQEEAEDAGERLAATTIATAINRLASSYTSESTITTVPLPSEEMKGRIIGREGRNIRALEQATGITLTIDDTPNAIVLSGFDPIRKYIAKLAITELIADGRIHPTRIDEAVFKATQQTERDIKRYGEEAAQRTGAMNLHPEIHILLGRLKFRYSYGQNVLDHSIEVAHLMGLMAAELGLDIRLAKRIGLLHDMGKAVSHEIDGSHATVGHDIALRYHETPDVANGIGCHHFEMPPTTIEGSLCSAADAISASRPGARVEAVEEYVKRLKNLEELAYTFPGVDKAYAMQAGREIRIMVLPDMIDDAGAVNLARDLKTRIESDLHYSGKIRVTVIREKRAVEYAV